MEIIESSLRGVIHTEEYMISYQLATDSFKYLDKDIKYHIVKYEGKNILVDLDAYLLGDNCDLQLMTNVYRLNGKLFATPSIICNERVHIIGIREKRTINGIGVHTKFIPHSKESSMDYALLYVDEFIIPMLMSCTPFSVSLDVIGTDNTSVFDIEGGPIIFIKNVARYDNYIFISLLDDSSKACVRFIIDTDTSMFTVQKSIFNDSDAIFKCMTNNDFIKWRLSKLPLEDVYCGN